MTKQYDMFARAFNAHCVCVCVCMFRRIIVKCECHLDEYESTHVQFLSNSTPLQGEDTNNNNNKLHHGTSELCYY